MAINFKKFLNGKTRVLTGKVDFNKFLPETFGAPAFSPEKQLLEQNIQSFVRLGMSEEDARKIIGEKISITPHKVIRLPDGGEYRSDFWFGEDFRLERRGFSQKQLKEFAERDEVKRKDILGVTIAELDHIIPLSIGGTNEEINLKMEKAKRSIFDFLKRTPKNELPHKKRQAGRLIQEKVIIKMFQDKDITQREAVKMMKKLKVEPDILDKLDSIAKKVENIYSMYTGIIGQGVNLIGQGVGYIVGGSLEWLKTNDKEKARTQAQITSKLTGDFGQEIGKNAAELAPVAYITPYAIDAAIIYAIGQDVRSAAKDAGITYETSQSGLKATEAGIRGLSAKGLEKIGVSPEVAIDLVQRNPLIASSGLFIEALLTAWASRGMTTRMRNQMVGKGIIKGKQINVTTKQIQDILRSKGKPAHKDLPQGTWRLTEIKPTVKGKLLLPIKQIGTRYRFAEFQPSKQLGTAETQLVKMDALMTSAKPVSIPVTPPAVPAAAVKPIDFGKFIEKPLKVEPEIIKVPREQLPVEPAFGKGKVKPSRLASRLKAGFKDLSDAEKELLPEFRSISRESQIRQASKFVEKDLQKALRVLKGIEEAPKVLLHTSIARALFEHAQLKKDLNLAIDLASFRATRQGQELSMLVGLDQDNPAVIINRITQARVKALTKSDKGKLKVSQADKTSLRSSIKKAQPKKDEYLEFIESIKC